MSTKLNNLTTPGCASCSHETSKRLCRVEKGLASAGCPTIAPRDILERATSLYKDTWTLEFARMASIQEAECYANRHQRPYIMQPTKTRMLEICEFARKMGYSKLGLAFCIGLANEAKVVDEILKAQGFEVVSVICKAGRVPKEFIGIEDSEKIYQGTEEAMCNPIYQALLLNEHETQLNILLGLCVGHDSLFFRHAKAPTTVLAVKDRVTGHNPLAAIYLAGSYYRRLRVSGL